MQAQQRLRRSCLRKEARPPLSKKRISTITVYHPVHVFSIFPDNTLCQKARNDMKPHKDFSLCKFPDFGYDRVRLEVTNMQINEVWSISDERIKAFFLSQDDVEQKGDIRFSYRQCEICLTPLPLRRVGRFDFPQTQLEFKGPEQDTEGIHHRFVLQFISAGA